MDFNLFSKRYKITITDAHFAACLLSPSKELQLSDDEKELGIQFIEEYFPVHFMPMFLKFLGKISPFRNSYFEKIEMTDFEWWNSIQKLHPNILSSTYLTCIGQLLTAVASSAGIERVFSKFGLVHSKIKNKLGVEKAAKLVFIHQQLN